MTKPAPKKAAEKAITKKSVRRRRALDTSSSTDWRATTLSHVRTLIERALPGVVEERKWRDVPVWSRDGHPICTGETYQRVVKLTFFRGAALPDPARLFNASLGGAVRRAIDLREGDAIDASAFTALLRAAAAKSGPRR